jgi:signal transduction histidine kinase
MLSTRHDSRFLTRLQPVGYRCESGRVERVLVFSRLFLAFTAVAAARLQPVAPSHYNHIALFMLVAYIANALGQLLWLSFREPGPEYVWLAQLGDIAWPILLTMLSDAPDSIFVMFFAFALLAAAFRWGLPETLLTALISIVLVLLQAVFFAKGPRSIQNLLFSDVEWHRVVLRCGYILLTGVLVGLLAEMEKELRAEMAFTNRLLGVARAGNRSADVLHEVLSDFGRVFGTQEVYQIVYHSGTGRLYRWDVPESPTVARVRELPPQTKNGELMPELPYAFFLRQSGNRLLMDGLDEEGGCVEPDSDRPLKLPKGVRSMLGVKFEMGREWEGRFVLLNATMGANRARELRFASNALRQLAPALYSMYLFRRLRSHAGALERAHVARELHDTAVQSLISIEMQVDVLRRVAHGDSGMASELARIQELLREEIFNLRELMQSLRAIDVGPHQFLDFVSELVERFRRDTGVDARFVFELPEGDVPSPVCRELTRVVQEGLANVRKHSGAHSVQVSLRAVNGSWQLVINDDGKGFPFSGRQTLSELDQYRRGPVVIKERVRALGGNLVVESTPGHGSTLEITVPKKGFESHG